MEGDAAATAIEFLLHSLADVIKEEILLIQGLDEDAETLKQTLGLIQSFLDDAEKKFISDDAVKRWLAEIEVVAFDADNVLDELHYHHLSNSKQVKSTQTGKEKVPSCVPSFIYCVRPRRRRIMAVKIKRINKRFENIRKNALALGIERRIGDAPSAPDADGSLETDSFTVDPIFVGRDDDVSKIVDMLTQGGQTEQVLSVLPIVGMGGLGKTTLTRNVFNHQQIKTHFGKSIWVHVSTSFEPVSLLKKILATLTSGGGYEGESKEVVLQKLQQALVGKTYLLVLDDLWNQDPLLWDGFINSLSGITSGKGSSIIVTTRNTEVASIVKTLYIHHLNDLSQEYCWSIIKAKAFGERGVPPGFETIGRNIAKRCQGLPLAANVVGGVLRDKSQDDWVSIERDWLSDVGANEDNVSKILKLSIDNLSKTLLKKCFVYCSLFSKGEMINKQQLIEFWMAEGFLQPDERSDMETVGNKYFNLLLQNSLLQDAGFKDYYGNTMNCSMHDLVHDVASSVLQDQYYRRESSVVPKEQAVRLRTLFFEGDISNMMFSSFESLHVLTLENYGITNLPDSMRELIHLRCLNISGTSICSLPNSIGELYQLQTLRAETSLLSKLPITLKHLIGLRHLLVSEHTETPPNLRMLSSLQTLRFFKVEDEEVQRIEELGELKNLKGELKIANLEKVHDKEAAEGAFLIQKPNIVELALWWSELKEGERNDEQVLEGLQPHPNLKVLEIWGFCGTRFPQWTLKMTVRDEPCSSWVALNNLVKIQLSDCSECEEIPMMGQLPHLEYIVLSGLPSVRSIGPSFYGSTDGPIILFPALKRLTLRNMENLTNWAEAETNQVKVFPCLEELHINNCKQLQSAPNQFPCLEVLNIYEMDSGLPLANILGGAIKLTTLDLTAVDGLEYLPDGLFHNNPNLSKLKLTRCPNLSELPNNLNTLSSFEKLYISHCPNLKSIPYHYPSSSDGQGSTSLRVLDIRDCKGLTELPYEMVESCALYLEDLSLMNLSSGVLNLPEIIECLDKMPRLRHLKIVNVPKLILSKEIESLRSLKTLKISPAASDSWDCANMAVGGILKAASQSLDTLQLWGLEDWDSLPDQLQHLTLLSFLELDNFGIEELPEWFGNQPTSLRKLQLLNCKKLKHLPCVEAMRRLTNLNELRINGCPILEERCIGQQQISTPDDDSEWPKISHIRNIMVGGYLVRMRGRTLEPYGYLDDVRQL